MKSARNARTFSRLLDPAASINSDSSDNSESKPVCESCNWAVLQTRHFRGRMLCLSCIAEYFDAEGEEDNS